MKINSNSKSLFNSLKEVFSSKEFFAEIGERIFGSIVGIAAAILFILGIAWCIDKHNENEERKAEEAKRKAEEEERKRKEEDKKRREKEIEEDLRSLRKIYDLNFNEVIAGIAFNNLHKVENDFNHFCYSEVKETAINRKLNDKDFENFKNAVINARGKLERVIL